MTNIKELQTRIIADLGVKPEIDPADEIDMRVEFLKSYIEYAHAKGLVLGISGGQDSCLAGVLSRLAVQDLKIENSDQEFVALRLPFGTQKDEEDARKSIDFINPDRVLTVNIQDAVNESARHSIAQFPGITKEKYDFLKGNIKARERMKVHYDVAGFYNLLVVGTDHAAEAVTGFFTKFGDGGADVLPLAGLTKRQGKEILLYLNAPEEITEKVPTADLLDGNPGQADEAELGLTYDQIDDFLEGKDVPDEVAEKIIDRYRLTMHKRTLPVTPDDEWWM